VNGVLADHHTDPARGDGRGQVVAADGGHVAGGRCHPDGRRDAGQPGLRGLSAPAHPAQFSTRIQFLKEEVFEICGALALAESLLLRLGLTAEAGRLSGLFDAVEGRLVEPQPSEGAVPSEAASSDAASSLLS
jgi:hypothetical protein